MDVTEQTGTITDLLCFFANAVDGVNIWLIIHVGCCYYCLSEYSRCYSIPILSNSKATFLLEV